MQTVTDSTLERKTADVFGKWLDLCNLAEQSRRPEAALGALSDALKQMEIEWQAHHEAVTKHDQSLAPGNFIGRSRWRDCIICISQFYLF